MVTGKIVKEWNNGYTFITAESGQKVFFHSSNSEREDCERFFPKGAKVEFELVQTARGFQANNVTLIDAPEISTPIIAEDAEGHVTTWFAERGYGFFNGADHTDVFIHISAVRGAIEKGSVVRTKITQTERGLEAVDAQVVGWNRTGDLFRDFAVYPANWPEDLASIAEDENWDYRFTATKQSLPVLRRYLRHTFLRLSETGKVVEAERDGERWAAYNTGLVNSLQNEIIALLRGHPEHSDRYQFVRFAVEGDRQLLTLFGGEQPSIARYFDDPSQLLYNDQLPLFIAIDHVDERSSRAPAELQGNQFGFLSAINAQKEAVARRAARNYKTAIPHFYRPHGRGSGQLQLLLPLCLVKPDRVDLALAVERIENTYRGNTVLTLDMAYTNARLLTRPDTEWLRPEQSEDPVSGLSAMGGVGGRGADEEED
jgi:cold shock CspA family protein